MKKVAGTEEPELTSAQRQSIGLKRYWNDPERSGAHREKMVESGRRMGKANKGKSKSEETRRRMREAQRRRRRR